MEKKRIALAYSHHAGLFSRQYRSLCHLRSSAQYDAHSIVSTVKLDYNIYSYKADVQLR